MVLGIGNIYFVKGLEMFIPFLLGMQRYVPVFGRSADNILMDQLWLGDLSVAHNYGWLKSQGITHIVTIMKEDLLQYYPDDFKYLHVRKRDTTSTVMLDIWPSTIAFIEDAITNGGKVYVHCKMGRSRSVSTVAAYLIYKYHLNVSEALAYIRNRRLQGYPNEYFILQLHIWQKQLRSLRNTK